MVKKLSEEDLVRLSHELRIVELKFERANILLESERKKEYLRIFAADKKREREAKWLEKNTPSNSRGRP